LHLLFNDIITVTGHFNRRIRPKAEINSSLFVDQGVNMMLSIKFKSIILMRGTGYHADHTA
jgi:hypothetical protein